MLVSLTLAALHFRVEKSTNELLIRKRAAYCASGEDPRLIRSSSLFDALVMLATC